MPALVFSVFLASVIGGLHCAGMCGGFLAIALHPGKDGTTRPLAPMLAYHLGRLGSYSLLGAIAGTIGGLVTLGGALAGVANLATMLAGGLMVLFGLSILSSAFGRPRLLGGRLGSAITQRLKKLARPLHLKALKMPPMRRAGFIGLATPLLPCGWLYAFAATAAGTGSPWKAAIVMAVFWAGTLPALATLGLGLHTMLGPAAKRLPVITALLLMGVGLWTLIGRAPLDVNTLLAATAHAGGEPTVPSADETPACCLPDSAGSTAPEVAR